MTQTKFDEVLSIARQYGVYLFSDEVYRLLDFHDSSPLGGKTILAEWQHMEPSELTLYDPLR